MKCLKYQKYTSINITHTHVPTFQISLSLFIKKQNITEATEGPLPFNSLSLPRWTSESISVAVLFHDPHTYPQTLRVLHVWINCNYVKCHLAWIWICHNLLITLLTFKAFVLISICYYTQRYLENLSPCTLTHGQFSQK